MPFITKLKVQPIRGTDQRKLLAPLVYVDEEVGAITVLSGFLTDYASIPKVIPRWWLDSDSGGVREASVIHDALYSKSYVLFNRESIDRKLADLIFYRGMRELGCPWLKAKSAYYAVRLFGGLFWEGDDEAN